MPCWDLSHWPWRINRRLNSYVDELPITAGDLASATRKDPVLGRVYDFSLDEWPQSMEDPLLLPYFSRREELSADQGCVLWG